jgi:ABC-type multidrug transport system ATPase subunit
MTNLKVNATPSSTWYQLNALLRKQGVLQRRQTKTNCCQCIFPLLLLIMLVLVSQLSRALTEKTTPEVAAPVPAAGVVDVLSFKLGDLAMPYTSSGSASVSATDLAKLFNTSGQFNSNGIIKAITNPAPVFLPNPQLFSGKAAVDQYMFDNWGVQYIIAGGYVVSGLSFSGASPQLSYALYYNETVESVGRGIKGQDVPGPMLAATRSYIQNAAAAVGKNASYSVKYSQLPTKKDTTFVDFVAFVEPLYYTWILHFLMPVFVDAVVYEKEHKLRDMMRMMGLKTGVYWWMQYFFDWLLYFASASVLIIFGNVLGLRFFRMNDPALYVILIALWGFTLIAMSLFASTLFRTTQASTITLYFFVILAGIAGNVTISMLSDEPSTPDSTWAIVSLIPTFALTRALTALSTGASGRNPGIRMADANAAGVKIYDVYGFLIGEAIFFYLLFVLIEFWPSIALFFRRKSHSKYQKLKNPIAGERVMEAPEVAKERARAERIMTALQSEDESQWRRLDPAEARGVVIRGLMKRFVTSTRDVTAVNNLSLVIPENCLTAVLGHNGAGKTTTINILCGMYDASSGSITMGGYDRITEMGHIYNIMGVCAQFDLLWENQTGREHMLFFGRIKGLKGKDLENAVTSGLKTVNLLEFQNTRVGGYSGGMKRRLSVAISLIGDPKIVFMDEPSTGMDPHSRREVWDAIQAVKPGRAIILTTHSMEEADALSDRIAIMNHGRLVAVGHSEELKTRYGHGYRLSVSVVNAAKNDANCKRWVLANVQGAVITDSLNGTTHYNVPYSTIKMSTVFRMMEENRNQLGISDWGLSRTSLEEVFEYLTKEDAKTEDIKVSSTPSPQTA